MADHVIIADGGIIRRLRRSGLRTDMLVKEAVEDIAEFAANEAKRFAPRSTGNLVRNITSTPAHRTGTGQYQATAGVMRTAPYARYVEHGTGIFGPKGTPIRATAGNLLVFKIDGRTIFTRAVKGQPAQHYMRKAYETTSFIYVRMRLAKLGRDVGNL